MCGCGGEKEKTTLKASELYVIPGPGTGGGVEMMRPRRNKSQERKVWSSARKFPSDQKLLVKTVAFSIQIQYSIFNIQYSIFLTEEKV